MSMRTIKILLVEDEEHAIDFCKNILSRFASKVFIAKSGEAALEILEKEAVDGVFIDIQLPGINGFVLAERIRASDKHHFLPIVFATGSNNDFPETYKRYHNFDYIQKPFDTKTFTEITKKFFGEIEKINSTAAHSRDKVINIKTKEGIHLVKTRDILFAEVKRNKIRLMTIDDEFWILNFTLNKLICYVNDERFVQCNKSCAVNISNILSVVKISPKTWDLFFDNKDSRKCELSYSYRDNVLRQVK